MEIMISLLFGLSTTLAPALTAQAINSVDTKEIAPIEAKVELEKSEDLIVVSIPKQELYLIKDSKIVSTYPISTGKNGAGSEIGSQKTPIGHHKVIKKIGKGADIGTVIKAGIVTDEKAEIITEAIDIDTDLLTTRVIWLDGQEEGINKGGDVDSLTRGIMIHGTPEEGLIGSPASHGCIRMLNEDVIDLFNQISIGADVLIENNF